MRFGIILAVFLLLLSVAFCDTILVILTKTGTSLQVGQCVYISVMPNAYANNLGITAVFSNTSAVTLNTSSYNVTLSTNAFVFSACAVNGATPQTVGITFDSTGTDTNSNSFQINNGVFSPINLKLVAPTGFTITTWGPAFPNTNINGTISVTTNLDGTVYYYIRDPVDISAPADPLSLATLKTAVANNINYIHSQSDYLSYL
jgi:hypothetical protein